MSKHWIETVWQLPKDEVEDFSVFLAQLGCLGSFEDLPLEENAQKATSQLKAYFPDQDLEHLKTRLQTLLDCESNLAFSENIGTLGETRDGIILLSRQQKIPSGLGPRRVIFSENVKLKSTQKIPEAGWATEWKKYFKPFFLTKEIVICPSWEKYTKIGNENVVILDPGMAFGTGQHDTTKFCAEFVCEIKNEHPNLKSFLDVGCGSGILALIAKKLGFETVVGIDTDPVAIETAKENLERNLEISSEKCRDPCFAINMPDGMFGAMRRGGRVKSFAPAAKIGEGGPRSLKEDGDEIVPRGRVGSEPIFVRTEMTIPDRTPTGDIFRKKFDLVVSNIIAETLCELHDDLIEQISPNGFLILSGIMPERAALVKEKFADLKLVGEKKSSGWQAFLYQGPPSLDLKTLLRAPSSSVLDQEGSPLVSFHSSDPNHPNR